MSFCLHSYDDSISYKSPFTNNSLEYYNPPVFLFFRKFNLYATSKDQNKIHNLTPKRKNSKIIILATLELFHLAYS